MDKQNFKIGQIINVLIKRIGINAEGIGYINNMAVFVNDCLPGEEVTCQIIKVYDNHLDAALIEVLNFSSDRSNPICLIYDTCGGCSFQHFSYGKMLESKRDILIRSLGRYSGGFPLEIFKDIIKAKDSIKYRSKVSLSLYYVDGENRFALFDHKNKKLSFLSDCIMHNEIINNILIELENLFDNYNLRGFSNDLENFDINSVTIKQNSLSSIVILYNLHQINLETLTKLKKITEHLVLKFHDSIISVLYKDSDSGSIVLYGDEFIVEEKKGSRFLVKSSTFVEALPKHSSNYYDLISNYIKSSNSKNILSVNDELGYSLHSLKDLNGINLNYYSDSNFFQREAETLFSDFKNLKIIDNLENGFDFLYIEAPRSGLGFKKIDYILKSNIDTVLYSSCNPSTLGKDLKILKEKYFVNEITAFDMFPYTSSVLSLTYLTLKY